MAANIANIYEMYKLLNEKERENHVMMSVFGRLGLSLPLRRFGETARRICLATDYLPLPVPLQRDEHIWLVPKGLPL